MSFDERLGSKEFTVPTCTRCKKTVWPPSEYCSRCFGKTEPRRGSPKARIIEFSKKNKGYYFCLVEVEESFRIIARSKQIPTVGKTVSITECKMDDGNHFFEIS